jgi:hypothetical protein
MTTPNNMPTRSQFDEEDLLLQQIEREFQQEASPSNAATAQAPPLSMAPTVQQPPALPIPQPTPEYLYWCDSPAVQSPAALPLLVILDLNGSLLFRHPNDRTIIDLRPDVKSFIRYLLQTHWVMIWSSATSSSVDRMLSELFMPSEKQNLIAIWDRSHLDLTRDQYYSNIRVYKQLSNVWENMGIQATHPWRQSGFQWNMSNTVLIDDSAVKATSEPFNLLEVPTFGGVERLDTSCTSILRQVAGYLEYLRYISNVSWCLKHSPFVVNAGFYYEWPIEGDGVING